MSMTVADAPIVGQVSPDALPVIATKLNEWREAMPTVVPDRERAGELQAYAVTVNGVMVGGYLLLSAPLANEILALAINPAHRKRGYGRMCCMDALFRSGKRPLVLTANDDSVGFARAVGFKVIGKRKQADGSVLTRLGWHAPRPGADPANPAGC
jgi:ribosomal protein S18 acetylase RimI-like enzyme